jgi:hypothetical protein
MSKDRSVGGAEALRRAMLAMIDKGDARRELPAYWVPFADGGEGAADEVACNAHDRGQPSDPGPLEALTALKSCHPRLPMPRSQPGCLLVRRNLAHLER